MFSAFKTNKNDKQKSSLLSGKKISNAQENSYENLRHIREIGSSTKTMTSIVNDDVEYNLLNMRTTTRPIIKTTILNENDCFATTDVVDHATAIPSTPLDNNVEINKIQKDNNSSKTLSLSSTFSPLTSSSSSLSLSPSTSTTEIFCINSNTTNNGSSNCNINSNRTLCDNGELNPRTMSPVLLASTSSTDTKKIGININENNIVDSPSNSPTTSRCSSRCSNNSNSSNSSSTSCELTTIVVSSSSSSSSNHTNTSANTINSTTMSAITNNPNVTDNAKECSTISTTINNSNKTLDENHTPPIIMSKLRNGNGSSPMQISSASNSATTTPKNSRYNKPRLSISGFSNGSMPSVHGRSGCIAANNSNGGQPKTRLSTHQRNLSLDFRSMGILLPPVSQVTNTRINLTQHHRNRSLDSALQRIPEVEVSSPNAETENTFCTNSILGSTMCSKIVSSSSSSSTVSSSSSSSSSSTTQTSSTSTTNQKNATEILNNSVDKCRILEPCAQPKSNLNSETTATNNNKTATDCKKREDLTSLGSDDSGIICGSESDQVSLNRVRQSHESLDSGEMDPEEECIEILETTSMDEEYKMLQSDLCFYQTPEKDVRSIKTRRKVNDQIQQNTICNTKGLVENKEIERKNDKLIENARNFCQNLSRSSLIIDNNRICVPIEIDNDNNKNKDKPTTPDTLSDTTPTPTEENSNKSIDSNCNRNTSSKAESESKSEHIKNEVLFKNFFGATKNAIFRTAQSIIENHEKKNSSKNKLEDSSDIKSPIEISKKKEFFVLKSSSSKNKASSTATTTTTTIMSSETTATPEIEIKQIPQSTSGNSLQKLKVPGVVKCFIKEKDQQQQPKKTEKGHSGLLRFFESPVFNIHFAIHYLFYSKEPGVLSFIGNKIFSFPDHDVDLYIPQLIVMYIQMDELAEVLDPYLTVRCKKSVDFSLKCLWLLEAYNYNVDTLSPTSLNKKTHLSLMKELYPKKERKLLKTHETDVISPIKKTHHRSQSDATGLLNDSKRFPSSGALTLAAKIYPPTPVKLCLGDLTSGKAFDNGCICFESVQGTVNDLLGQKTFCHCNAPKMAPQKEFMKALINIGKNLTSLQTKAEKTSALRMFLNLINKNLPARVWLPLHSDIPHHIVRITEEKTAVLNSKDKTPYIIYVEVVEVSDIYSSPVIMKMMPTLRHTKSEEHLESKDTNLPSQTKTNSIGNSGKEQQHKNSESECHSKNDLNELNFTEDDVWSQEDDEITAQYLNLHKTSERDAISQMSLDSCDSRDQGIPTLFNIGDVRTRHCNNLNCENTKPFSNDPEDPSAAALKEPWHEKEKQIRESSPYGHLSNWRLLSAIVKCGDDLRQELMATQLLQMFKIIWQEENIDLWVRPYKIVCLSNDSGLIEPILNTVSLHQIKKNSNKSLRDYFIDEYGDIESNKFKKAQRNFMQSCAAYCLISYLLQVKDRHNGNILLHSDGHLIHIDFGFILSISPKNLGFEQSPFKLTPEFVDVMGGTSSELWIEFNHLLLKGIMAARKHMDRIINLVEIMRSNAQLPCFKNGCSGTVQNLRKRFHMNLTEQELEKKVEQLVQDSLKSLSTKLYDGYQYFTNGIL